MTISGRVTGTMANGGSEANYKNSHTTEKAEKHIYARKQNSALLQKPVRLVGPGVDMGNH